MKKRNRKQTFVDSHVQGALIRRILVHWLLFFGITAMLIVAMNALGADPSLSLVERITSGGSGNMFLFALVMLCLFPAFALDTIRFSNRFVGPITRVRRCLRELGTTGETERITFRDNDFWAEMAKEFNAVADRVRNAEQGNTTESEENKENTESVESV